MNAPMTVRKAGPMGRRFAGALALAATGVLFAASADAQIFERRQDFFPFSLFGDRGGPPSGYPGYRGGGGGGAIAVPSESAKAPPPRKLETAPTSTVLVIGDSLADWLAHGLEEALTDTPEIGVVRKIRPTSGLVRYDLRNEAAEWPPAVKETLASEQPSVIVVMLGLNDRQALRERINPKPQKQETPTPAQGQGQGQSEAPAASSGSEPAQQSSGEQAAQPAPPAAAPAPASEPSRPVQTVSYEFHTDKWTEAYTKRVDEMITALKAKGVPVLWVGLPALRTRTNSDVTYLDEIYRARAARAGIVYVDVWDGFVDDQGRFAVQGPDFEGQIRRLRSNDGVHFTKAGAVKLAHYVEHDLRRVMANRPVPVAVPGAEEQAPKVPGGVTARPAVGAVVPLTSAATETGDLLGAGATPAPGGAAADPVVARVLNRGDAIAAPPSGRADNFSWPRPDATANISTDVEIVPPPAAPAQQPAAAAKAAPGKSVVQKPDKPEKPGAKPDAKKEATPETPPLRGPRRSRVELDGGLRPPSPVGGGIR
jgi:uncharacterized protein